MNQRANSAFAAVDTDHVLERVAGGNETEVYRSDDGRYVVKLKEELGGRLETALAHAKQMRAAAERYAACLGPRHTIPSHYLITRDDAGHVQVLVMQPFVEHARPLFTLDLDELSQADRDALATELEEIISAALRLYRRRGEMPDLYGRTSTSPTERSRQRSLRNLPERMWSFLIKRNLLRSHNLLWTGAPERRVVLVDYDEVRRSRLYRMVYFFTRFFLFWRDRAIILLQLRAGLGN